MPLADLIDRAFFGTSTKRYAEPPTRPQHSSGLSPAAVTLASRNTIDWDRLTKVLGFDPTLDPRVSALVKFMVEQQIPIYPYGAVRSHMTMLARRRGQLFIWRAIGFAGWHMIPNFGHTHGHDHYNRGYTKGCVPVGYDVVPIHVKPDVRAIHNRFPEAQYMVADCSDPDPFICVLFPDQPDYRIVFGAWDEPDFKPV